MTKFEKDIGEWLDSPSGYYLTEGMNPNTWIAVVVFGGICILSLGLFLYIAASRLGWL